MKITFKVFGKNVPVKFKPIAQETGLEGYFSPSEYLIVVDADSDNKLQTAMHELFHAVWFRLGLLQIKVSEDTQEIIVENLATAVLENFEQLIKVQKMK